MADDRQRGTWFRTRHQARSQFRPSAAFSLPFKTVTPSQLATPSFSSSYPSSPSARIVSHDILGKAGRTVREHDKEIDALRKDNFTLKLRIYLLEQKFSEAAGRDVADAVQANVQLHIQLEALQKEIQCKERSFKETMKIAKENELAYQKAKEKILSLQEEVSNLKEELENKEKFETPKGSSVSSSDVFKEASDMWSFENQSASVRFSDGDLNEKVSCLQKELMIKDLEIQQSSVTIKQLQESIEALQLHSKKKSKVIQSLVYKMKDFIEGDSKEMWHAVNEGVEAAKNKDINKVLYFVSKIKQRFCELVSMSSEDLFHETFDTARIKSSTAIKNKEIQDQDPISKKSLVNETDIVQYLDELDSEISIAKKGALESEELNQDSIIIDAPADKFPSFPELQGQLDSKDFKPQTAVADSATQTYICANIMDEEAWNNMIARLGQTDLVETLKEEILVLLMKLEQKEKDTNTLRNEINNLQNEIKDVVSQKSVISAQVKMLQQHLEKLAVVMEDLIHHKYRLSDSSLTPKILEEASRFLDDTLQLSRRLSGNLMVFEQSFLSHCDSSIFTSSFNDGIGRFSIPFSLKRQSHPVNETLFEEHEINEQSKNANDLLFNEDQALKHCGKNCDSDFIKFSGISTAKSNALSSDLGTVMVNSSHLNPERNACSGKFRTKSTGVLDNHSAALDFFGADLLHGHQHQVSSDSDIWSEPDRNLSNQRVGIEMTAPTPPRQRSKTDMGHSEGTDSSSDGVDRFSTGNQQKLRRGLFQKPCSKSKQLEDQFEKGIPVIEFYEKKFEDFFKSVEGFFTQLNNASSSTPSEGTSSLSEICAEIKNFKDVLNGAVHDIKAVKESSVNTKTQHFKETAVQELKEYMENILVTLNDKEENHVTASQAKDIAERALLELDIFKKQLMRVCTALVEGDNGTDPTMETVQSSTDCIQSLKNNSFGIGDANHDLNDLIPKQKSEIIRLKQSLSYLKKENEFLENKLNRISSSRSEDASFKPCVNCREIECQTEKESSVQSKFLCESLQLELETLHKRLKELETKYFEAEKKYENVLGDKTSLSFENNELKKNIRLLENHVSELTLECTGVKSKSSNTIENLEKRLACAENNVKLLRSQNTQAQEKFQHSEEIYQSMKVQLADAHKKLEEMKTKCGQCEKQLQNSSARDVNSYAANKRNSTEQITNYGSETSISNEAGKKLEFALQFTQSKLRDVEHQFESLQKSAFLLESNSYIHSVSTDKGPTNLVDKMKKFQKLLHRAHVIRNFVCIVNSVVIRNLRKKLQSKEEKMRSLEFELLFHQQCNNTSESMHSALIDLGTELSIPSPYKSNKSNHSNFEAEFSEINTFHESKLEAAESNTSYISFGMNTESKNSNQYSPKDQLQLHSSLAQEEIGEVKNKFESIVNSLIETGSVSDEYGIQKEAFTCVKSKSEGDGSSFKLLKLVKENESLKQRVSAMAKAFKDVEQERLMLYQQMKDKSDRIEKLNEETKRAFEKANHFETLCIKNSGEVDTLNVLVKNRNACVEQLLTDLKQESFLVDKLENVLQELYQKLEDFNVVSMELFNSKDIINILKNDLECKTQEESNLKKQIQDLRKNLEQTKLLATDLQNELDGKNEFVSNLQNMLKKKGELVEQLHKEIQNLKADISELKGNEAEKEDQISRLKWDLDHQTKYLSELQVSYEETSKLVETLQNEIKAKNFEKLKTEIDEKTALVQNLKEKLAENLLSHQHLSDSLQQKEEFINSLLEQQKDKNLLIEELKSRGVEYFATIQRLQEEKNTNSELICKLQDSVKEKTKLVGEIESEINKNKSEYKVEIDRKSALISLLEKDLKLASGHIDKKTAMIEELQSEVGTKVTVIKKLEFDSNSKAKVFERRINELEKQINSYKKQGSTGGFEVSRSKEHWRNESSKSFYRNSDLMTASPYVESSSTSYELKAILPAEKENPKFFDESYGKGDFSDNEQNSRRLNETELCLKECRKEKLKLEKKLQKLSQNQKILLSLNSEPPEFIPSKSDQEIITYNDECKWNLQKDILSLQTEIFKENSLHASKHEKFVNRILDFHSLASASKDDKNLARELVVKLKLDVEFLQNIKIFLVYFIIPLLQNSLKNGLVEAPIDTINDKNQKKSSKKEAKENTYAASKGKTDEAIDKESALSSDNGAPISRSESQASFPSSCDSRCSSEHHRELGCHNCLSSDQNEKAENAIAADVMQLRPDYSSPDLGIESDPNQDIVVPDILKKVLAKESSLKVNGTNPKNIKEYMKGISSCEASSLLVIAMLKDYELLKKQMQESMAQMKFVTSRANDGLKRINRSSTPKKLFELATLKSILDKCNDIEVCLNQAESLIDNFSIISWPIEDECAYAISVLMENQELKKKLKELQRKLHLREKELNKAMHQLTHEKKEKEKMDRVISKQLVETTKVLRKTKANLLAQGASSG